MPVNDSVPPSSARRPLSTALTVVATLTLSIGLLVGSPGPASAVAGKGQAAKASAWIATQVHDGRIHNGQFDFDDWGLTLDAYLALVATDRHPEKARHMIKAVSRHVKRYVQFNGDFFAGAVAKSLLARKVAGLSGTIPSAGLDLRSRLRSMITANGRVSDTGSPDYSSTLTQGLAVIAFSRSSGSPQRVVDYLLRQRCPRGYFREALGAERCGAAGSKPHVDSTAVAVQAMVAARKHDAHVPVRLIKRSRHWLRSVQNDNGSWSLLGTANTNSTGLAAQALATGRPTGAGTLAAAWVGRQQITRDRADGGPARRDIGAIALTPAGLAAALNHGITQSTRDSFRRATTQAQFALRPVPLGALSVHR